MAASSLSSDLISIFALIIVSLVALLLLRYFLPLRSTPSFLLVPIFFSLVLPISSILLVPVDLASSTRGEDKAGRGIWLQDGAILVAWRIIYWLMFALTWLILPLLGEYLDSGYRKPMDRFVYSLKSNGYFVLIVLGCCLVAGFYIVAQVGFEKASFKGLVMALAYCVTLIQAIYMMGHGLVSIPRRLIRESNVSNRLRRLHAQAPGIHEKMEDALVELTELEEQLKQLRRKSDLSAEHREWVEEMADIAPITKQRAARQAAFSNSVPSPPAFITDRYLADLTRRVNRARHKRSRFVGTWETLKQDVADVQAILNAQGSHQLVFPSRAGALWSLSSRATILNPTLRYYLHAKILPVGRLALAFVLSLASACVVWSELVKYAAPKLSLINLTVAHRTGDGEDVGLGGQAIAALWIFYMCSAVLVCFGDVKLWGNRALVRRNTYGESACFYAGQLAKLTVTLTYNFLTFIPPSIHQKTTFYKFLGKQIDFTPLGDWFDHLFPVLILLPICATLFNLYGRIKSVFHFDLLDDDDPEGGGSGTNGWREGRALIEADNNGDLHIDASADLLDASNARGTRGQPSLFIPPANDRSPNRSPAPTQRLSTAARAAQDEEDENVFSGLAHRVKNTIDSVERPEWLSDLGKRPKWMPGGDSAGGSSDIGRNLGRLFGGRQDSGQVRL